MARRATTLNLDGEVLSRAQALAEETGEPVEAVVERALVRHMGLIAMRRVQKRFDLDEDEALRVAYEELKGARAGT
ncbi:MAG: hypothetical protein M3450_05190 [Actinomycetota bacterium]|nr:hypothetical protein [Actinomycetota bacterium]